MMNERVKSAIRGAYMAQDQILEENATLKEALKAITDYQYGDHDYGCQCDQCLLVERGVKLELAEEALKAAQARERVLREAARRLRGNAHMVDGNEYYWAAHREHWDALEALLAPAVGGVEGRNGG